jgi:hypothetical protein
MFIIFKPHSLFFAFVVLSLIFASGPNQTVYGSEEEEDLSCRVEITGGEPKMYPGQYAFFEANLTGVQGTENYTWTIEGPIIKDYDDNVDNGTLFNVSRNIEPPTLMSPDDFQKSSISFYWQPNTTDMNRTVSVTVQTLDGKECQDSEDFTVAMSMDDIDKQAEDFYVEANHPIPGTNTSGVLQEHQSWHSRYRGPEASYFDQGDLFFDFHNLFIAHFDAWRELFGYSSIIEWNPGSPIPRGVEIDHNARYGYRNGNDQQPLPSWFNPLGGEDGIRPIFFIQNETGDPQQIPAGHPLEGHRAIVFVSTSDPRLDEDTRQFLQPFEGHTFPLCEEWDAPNNSSRYPIEQDSLDDFDPDRELLGCALTYPYHDTTHGRVAGDKNGTIGDMASTGTSPKDPIFWRFHKFIDSVSANRSQIGEPAPTLALGEESQQAIDTVPPRVFAQNPFRLHPFLTELPTISEQERDLFGIAGVPALSAEFSEPVTGVTAKDFTVNGSPATQVYGKGAGPYIFIGFKTPGIGPVNVTFAPGNITDEEGNRFEGSTWSYEIVESTADKDIDGVMDGLEVNLWRTDPTRSDVDGDGISDGLEVSSGCLNPLVNDMDAGMMSMGMFTLSLPVNDSNDDVNNSPSGVTMGVPGNSSSSSLDSDSDGMTNVQEINNKTDPCSPEQPQQTLQLPQGLFPRADNVTSLLAQNDTRGFPFAIVIQKSGGTAGATSSSLLYDSLSKVATSIVNGNKLSRQISDFDEQEAKRLFNNSGFFESTTTFYPPAAGSADYIEFTVIATSNGKLHAVYWTDVSEGVPEPIRNLPYIMAYVLGTGRVF